MSLLYAMTNKLKLVISQSRPITQKLKVQYKIVLAVFMYITWQCCNTAKHEVARTSQYIVDH